MTARATVLVTDGEQRAALATVRSLGAAGYSVYVCAATRGSLAGASRFTRADAIVPDALRDAAAFTAAVEQLARRWNVDVLIPISEAALLALLPRRDALAPVIIPFPELHLFERVCDKSQVVEAARALGIAVPRQARLESPADRHRLDPGALKFPLVIKPARSVIGVNGRRRKTMVTHVTAADQLSAALDTLPPDAYPVLLQERIEGAGAGVFLLLWDGQAIASFAHRRIREKPPAGGISVYCESVPLAPPLYERSLALLRAFGWQGVAMVEYKIDTRTGTPYLMEVNGRLWGSLQLAVDAGVDFPQLLVAAATGEPVTPVHQYRAAVRCRWVLGDLDHLLARLRHSRAELFMSAAGSGRLRALADFLVAFGVRHSEILRLSDPRPGLREVADWLRRDH